MLIAGTGKSFTEALILASTNPQYDKRLFSLQGPVIETLGRLGLPRRRD